MSEKPWIPEEGQVCIPFDGWCLMQIETATNIAFDYTNRARLYARGLRDEALMEELLQAMRKLQKIRKKMDGRIIQVAESTPDQYATAQKYDPFAVHNETHCGDCWATLTKGSDRLLDGYFSNGVRCVLCHDRYRQATQG